MKPTPKSTLTEFAEESVLEKDWIIPDHKDWQEMTLDSAHALVQQLMAAYKEGAGVINQRIYDTARESGTYKCMVCGKKRPLTVGEGNNARPGWVWRDDRPDPQSGIYTMRAICSQECHFRGTNSGKMTNAGVPGNVHK